MSVSTVAKATAWCLNCPDTIQPGDHILIDPSYAKPGTRRQPMIHAHCEGKTPYDPDEDPFFFGN